MSVLKIKQITDKVHQCFINTFPLLMHFNYSIKRKKSKCIFL